MVSTVLVPATAKMAECVCHSLDYVNVQVVSLATVAKREVNTQPINLKKNRIIFLL